MAEKQGELYKRTSTELDISTLIALKKVGITDRWVHTTKLDLAKADFPKYPTDEELDRHEGFSVFDLYDKWDNDVKAWFEKWFGIQK